MHTFLVGEKSSNLIQIDVIRRLHPNAQNQDDANWCLGKVILSVGCFSGEFDVYLTSNDFQSFLFQSQDLYQKLKGEAIFETLEEQIYIKLLGNGRGGIQVTGFAIDEVGIGNQLNFSFKIDQTYLIPMCLQLESVCKAYPIIEI